MKLGCEAADRELAMAVRCPRAAVFAQLLGDYTGVLRHAGVQAAARMWSQAPRSAGDSRAGAARTFFSGVSGRGQEIERGQDRLQARAISRAQVWPVPAAPPEERAVEVAEAHRHRSKWQVFPVDRHAVEPCGETILA